MFIFSEEKRPKLHQERPDLSDSELTRLLARMWNELPDKKKVGSVRVDHSTCPVWVNSRWTDDDRVCLTGCLLGLCRKSTSA